MGGAELLPTSPTGKVALDQRLFHMKQRLNNLRVTIKGWAFLDVSTVLSKRILLNNGGRLPSRCYSTDCST
jgi:hypothetical protein